MQKWKYVVPAVLLIGVSSADAAGWRFWERSSSAPVTSAQSVSAARDDAAVELRGQITGQQSNDRYIFSDQSGSVLVSVNDRSVEEPLAAGTPVEIVGAVDRDSSGRAEVEARSVTVLASASMPDSTFPGNEDFRHHTPD